jgi:hypothetical protein
VPDCGCAEWRSCSLRLPNRSETRTMAGNSPRLTKQQAFGSLEEQRQSMCRFANLATVGVAARQQMGTRELRETFISNRQRGCSESGSGSARRLRWLSQVPRYLPTQKSSCCSPKQWQRLWDFDPCHGYTAPHVISSAFPGHSARLAHQSHGRLHVCGSRLNGAPCRYAQYGRAEQLWGAHSAIFGPADNRWKRCHVSKCPTRRPGRKTTLQPQNFKAPTSRILFLCYHLPVLYRNR